MTREEQQSTTMEATRDFLRGKQTQGKCIAIGGTLAGPAFVKAEDATSTAKCYADHRSVTEARANAALYAEAGTVANRTGMWPEDLAARVKELEEGMRCCEFAMSNNRPQSKDGQEWEWGDVLTHARTILNKPTA